MFYWHKKKCLGLRKKAIKKNMPECFLNCADNCFLRAVNYRYMYKDNKELTYSYCYNRAMSEIQMAYEIYSCFVYDSPDKERWSTQILEDKHV